MTLTTTASRSGPYTATGSQTTFNREFLVYDEAQVKVYQTVAEVRSEVTTGLTHTGIGEDAGTVVFGTAPASGTIIEIERNMTLEQASDYSTQGAVNPEGIEQDLDEIVMMIQDIDALSLSAAVESAAASATAAAQFEANAAFSAQTASDAVDRFDTSNRISGGGFTDFDVVQSASSDLDPPEGARIKIRLHQSPVKGTSVRLRIGNGSSFGSYREVLYYNGGGSLVRHSDNPDQFGQLLINAAELTLVRTFGFWVAERTIAYGTGSHRAVQRDASGLIVGAGYERRVKQAFSTSVNSVEFSDLADAKQVLLSIRNLVVDNNAADVAIQVSQGGTWITSNHISTRFGTAAAPSIFSGTANKIAFTDQGTGVRNFVGEFFYFNVADEATMCRFDCGNVGGARYATGFGFTTNLFACDGIRLVADLSANITNFNIELGVIR